MHPTRTARNGSLSTARTTGRPRRFAAVAAAILVSTVGCGSSGDSPVTDDSGAYPPSGSGGSSGNDTASSGAGTGAASGSASGAGADASFAAPTSGSSGADGTSGSPTSGGLDASPGAPTSGSGDGGGESGLPSPMAEGGLAHALIHPGGWQTEADLTRVRSQVAANQAPWTTAWAAIKNTDANANYTSHPPASVTDAYAIQHDGHAAYVLAIKWVASGDATYAKAAMALIDAWTTTVTSVANEPLRNGLGSAQMANAAEILTHAFNGSAGWPAASVARAKSWFVNVVYLPHTKGGASANWGTSAMIGNISMAVFADDVAMFNDALSTYRHGFQPISGGCCGVTQYIDATGEDAESGRDQGHSQGGIGHLLEVAQIAWNQGVDLIGYNDDYGVRTYGASGANRLLVGLEYTAQYNLGNTVPYHPYFEYCNNVTKYPNGISALGRGNFSSQFWEMANSLFTEAGLPHPYSSQVLTQAGYVPEATSADHPGLGTLLFRK